MKPLNVIAGVILIASVSNFQLKGTCEERAFITEIVAAMSIADGGSCGGGCGTINLADGGSCGGGCGTINLI